MRRETVSLGPKEQQRLMVLNQVEWDGIVSCVGEALEALDKTNRLRLHRYERQR
jgi:hypothetical protein